MTPRDEDVGELLDALHAHRRYLARRAAVGAPRCGERLVRVDRLIATFRALRGRAGSIEGALPAPPPPPTTPTPPPQRGRVLAGNRHLAQVREFVRLAGVPLTRAQVAEAVGVSPPYAYDLLCALREGAEVERLRPGLYRYVAPGGEGAFTRSG